MAGSASSAACRSSARRESSCRIRARRGSTRSIAASTWPAPPASRTSPARPARSSEAAVQKLYGLPEIALIDMGDFVGGMLKYLRSHPVPGVTIAGGVAKMTKLAQGLTDLHSRRGEVDLALLAELGARRRRLGGIWPRGSPSPTRPRKLSSSRTRRRRRARRRGRARRAADRGAASSRAATLRSRLCCSIATARWPGGRRSGS